MWLETIIHWFHLIAAIIWIGGMVFAAFILQPALRRNLNVEERMPIYHEIGVKFRGVQWTALGVLLATGVYKLWGLRHSPEIFHSSFGVILAVKLSLAALVSVLSLLHAYIWGPRLTALAHQPGGLEFQGVMQTLVFWGRINLAAALAVVFFAAALRMNLF